MSNTILNTLAACVALGALGQVVASWTRMPAIVFLLLLGMVAGPFGLGLVQPAALGQGLSILTSAFVAIILFEGGLSLRPNLLRNAIVSVRRLITLGALITLAGSAALAKLVLGLSWSTAFVFGSLIVVTGPTVIAPILSRLRLQPRLHAVLKSESILIDPIGAILAIVVLQYVVDVVAQPGSWHQAFEGLFGRASIGIIVGGTIGVVAALVTRLPLFQQKGNEHLIKISALGLALVAFAMAESIYPESGIMAATVLGLVLSAAPLPFRLELEKFEEHLTTLTVSVLFVMLAANVRLDRLGGAGWREALLLAGLMFLVRPAAVLLSTWKTHLKWNEKAFLSLMAPRGIVAAAMASHFADHLRDFDPQAANQIESLVFLTIATTVCLQGAWAAPLARWLRVRADQPQEIVLIGINDWSMALADLFSRYHLPVRFIDTNLRKCHWSRKRGYIAFHADATDPHTYKENDICSSAFLLAMTANDHVNQRICATAKDYLGEDNIFQVVSQPTHDEEPPFLTGRWTMPSEYSHRTVRRMLTQRKLNVIVQSCAEPMQIGHDLYGPAGRIMPVLIQHGQDIRPAAVGDECPAGCSIIGFAGWPQEPILNYQI